MQIKSSNTELHCSTCSSIAFLIAMWMEPLVNGTIYHKNSNYEDNNPPPENTKSLAKKEREENINLHSEFFFF